MLKKEEPSEPPTDKVLKMKEGGLSEDRITQNLEGEEYNSQQISDAMNQADIKKEIRGPYQESAISQLEREAPSPPSKQPPVEKRSAQYPEPSIKGNTPQTQPPQIEYPIIERTLKDQVEELVESVVSEKWDELVSSLGNIGLWKEKVRDEIVSIKQEILRLERRFENLQKSVLGKVSEYNKNIQGVNVEVKALEKVFKNILTPLTTNIKELSKITEKLKK